jgi:radical SAM superfamily enzyme YgiQ (UPF0313 family)
MKILLIAPASGRWHGVARRRLCSGRTFRFSLLSLLTVAAETPTSDEVTIIDEQVEPVPGDLRPDLVGITAMTAAAPRAYALADGFRRRGVPVVLGGMHPTFLPDEALAHADAVCAGEAEGVWPSIVEDARRSRLGGVYRAPGPIDLTHLRPPPRHLLRRRHYGTVQAVQATRGCPHACSFCSVSAFHGGRIRRRPVPDVVHEVARLPGRFVLFVDDNLTADRDYLRELLLGLRPLGKQWMTQSTLALTDDEPLVALAAEAGCLGLFVGLETFSEPSLDASGKSFHRAREYEDRVCLLHAHGIGVEAGVVFGFPGDGPDVFRATVERLDEIAVDAVQISVLTPLPGTPLFEQLGPRIVERDWERYDYHHAVFEPRGMSPAVLQAGHDWATREFYRPWRITRRLARMARRPRGLRVMPYAVAVNAAYWGRVRSWQIGAAVRDSLRGERLYAAADLTKPSRRSA